MSVGLPPCAAWHGITRLWPVVACWHPGCSHGNDQSLVRRALSGQLPVRARNWIRRRTPGIQIKTAPMAEPELKSRGGQFHKLMPHLTRCYYLPACACSMNKRSQQGRWKMKWSACEYVKLVWWHRGWAPTSFNTMPANALRREILTKHILSLRSIAIVLGSSSQLS